MYEIDFTDLVGIDEKNCRFRITTGLMIRRCLCHWNTIAAAAVFNQLCLEYGDYCCSADVSKQPN